MRFKPFIDDLLLEGFDSSLTLYFPGPRPSLGVCNRVGINPGKHP